MELPLVVGLARSGRCPARVDRRHSPRTCPGGAAVDRPDAIGVGGAWDGLVVGLSTTPHTLERRRSVGPVGGRLPRQANLGGRAARQGATPATGGSGWNREDEPVSRALAIQAKPPHRCPLIQPRSLVETVAVPLAQRLDAAGLAAPVPGVVALRRLGGVMGEAIGGASDGEAPTSLPVRPYLGASLAAHSGLVLLRKRWLYHSVPFGCGSQPSCTSVLTISSMIFPFTQPCLGHQNQPLFSGLGVCRFVP